MSDEIDKTALLHQAFEAAITLRRSAEHTANQYDMNGLTRSVQADTLANMAEAVAYLVAQSVVSFMPDDVAALKAQLANVKADFAKGRKQFLSQTFSRVWQQS